MGAVADKLEAELSLSNAASLVPKRHGKLVIRSVAMLDAEGRQCWAFRSGNPVRILIVYEATERVERPVFSILIHRSDGLYVSSTNTYDINPLEVGPIDGSGELLVVISQLDLYEGDYLLSVGAYVEPDPPFWSTPAYFLDKQYRFRMLSAAGRHGVIVLPAEWEHRPSVGEGTL
jgi:hypothetical protein